MLHHLTASLAQALTESHTREDLATQVSVWIALAVSVGLVFDRLWNRGKKEGVDESTLNGIGGRVAVVEQSTTQAHARIEELVRRADKTDADMRIATGDISSLEAKVDQMLSQGTENKIEIISEFQRIANEVRAGFHALDVKVEKMAAVADERERVRAAA